MCNRNENPTFHWDEDLEEGEPAHTIASVDHSPLRVLAGPGTGKTFALIRRAARLLQEGEVPPDRIFACTFTRAAAQDLERELSTLQVPGAEDVVASTLHSFCFSLLRRDRVLELTRRMPRTLLTFEVRFLVEDIYRSSVDQFAGITNVKDRLSAFNAAWATRQTDKPGWPQKESDRVFAQQLGQWLRFHRCMHIGELIPLTLDYLRSNPQAPAHREFDVILVDEYQDLNRAEQELLDIIARDANFTIVGDEDQSIYSFLKHAHPEGVRDFERRHPETYTENLEVCRRCPGDIVRLASSLIQNNQTRAGRGFEPWPENEEGEVHVVQWGRRREEVHGLSDFIAERVNEVGVPPSEVLVLTGSRHIGRSIEQALVERGVAAHSFFSEKELKGAPGNPERNTAQKAFTLLTLLAHPEDRVALRAWCGFGGTTLYAGGWRRVREHSAEHGLDPGEVLEQLSNGVLDLPHTDPLIDRYETLVTTVTQLTELEGQDLVDELFPEGPEWSYALREHASHIETDGFGAQELHETIKTRITQPEPPLEANFVRVMSLHKSKGLSARLVVIAGCLEGLIPRHPDEDLTEAEEQQHFEEQRRLFYVGITRAKETLVISSFREIETRLGWNMRMPMNVPDYGQYGGVIGSRFFEDLGPELPRGQTSEEFLERG